MPGHFTLHDIRGQVLEQGEWKGVENVRALDSEGDFADIVDPVKIVYGVFFDSNGHGDVWLEFTLGHSGAIENPIRIDSFQFGSNNSDVEVEVAKTRYARRDNPAPYIWDEADSIDETEFKPADIASVAGKFGDWRSMYEEYSEFDNDDRIFACNVGEDRILCTPVRFDDPILIEERASDDSTHTSLWEVGNLRTLSNDTPILYPPDHIGEKISGDIDAIDQDTITLWVKWRDTNLTIPNDDISFHFRFAFHSNVGDIKHSYPYYVLPPKSSLMESLSAQPVNEFYPKDTHWMFLEWAKTYEVERAGTGRMTRSKVKDTDYVFNSGIFGFSNRRPKNMTLRFLYAVLGGGILANLALTPRSVWEQVLSILGILVLMILVYHTFLPRVTPVMRVMNSLEHYFLRLWDAIPLS